MEKKKVYYVVYCYYLPFATLPRRKWVKFTNKEDAIAFKKEKVDGRKDRFFWAFVVDCKEVEEL